LWFATLLEIFGFPTCKEANTNACDMSERIFFFEGDDPAMRKAYEAAQRSFRFFWRELSWERRRIIPALDMTIIKTPFTDGPRSDGNPEYEQMWLDEVEFDGTDLAGVLLNAPNWLTSVKQGDGVRVPFSRLTDWMMTSDDKAYGGYTVNLMRSRMSARERKAHDQAWGLDFGDPNEIRLIGGAQSGGEEKFADTPMCVNMLPKIEAQLQEDRSIATSTDERGWTLLHSEAMAGNFGVVKLLVHYGASVDAKTPNGQDAAELARGIGWDEIAKYLDENRGQKL
jgi:uncharacterized protein YegJ (DUF2314 family)